MIVLGDKKYACESCIKGHRSSSCKHTERPLFEVKKKGRPVTQCEHCRELRKSKQVHVKCLCGSAPMVLSPDAAAAAALSSGAATSTGASSPGAESPPEVAAPAPMGYKRRRVKKPLPDAAFPGGLPAEALEASRALQMLAAGTGDPASDCPHVTCLCESTGKCGCVDHANRVRRKPQLDDPPSASSSTALATSGDRATIGPSASGAASAAPKPAVPKVYFRPVLPRPPSNPDAESSTSPGGHDPSALTAHPHPRSHAALYSPYGRAYARSNSGVPEASSMASLTAAAAAVHEQPFAPPQTPTDAPFPEWLLSPAMPDTDTLATCGCGPTCACPGCGEHCSPHAMDASADIRLAFSQCTDPVRCSLCLQCAIAALPTFDGAPVQGQGAAFPDASAYGAIDEWVRQVEAHAQQVAQEPVQPAQPFAYDPPPIPNAHLAQAGDPEATPQPQWFYPLPDFPAPPPQQQTYDEYSAPAFPTGLGATAREGDGWYVVTSSSSDGSASPPPSEVASSRRSSHNGPLPPVVQGMREREGYDASFGDMRLF